MRERPIGMSRATIALVRPGSTPRARTTGAGGAEMRGAGAELAGAEARVGVISLPHPDACSASGQVHRAMRARQQTVPRADRLKTYGHVRHYRVKRKNADLVRPSVSVTSSRRQPPAQPFSDFHT
ncbi:hypothetical protein rosag_09250 [Roseisolibacter agri]|uniref:Uncharacterized protein n=1 Tax=Roseisolibacter agri TaxID=2014610 RepID=A0AA37Q4E0_9BACT|nr:hypothetical protein rosag_09250 [Roseisolibacter agri]